MHIICVLNLFLAVTSQIILITVKIRYLLFSKEVDIDSTEDGFPSVFPVLGFSSVFFYSCYSNACFLLFKC